MSGGWRTSCCAQWFWRTRFASRIAFLSIATGFALAGCAGVMPTAAPSAQARGGPVAFESVEGVPSEVFHRFVRMLNEEAATRQIAVTARGTEASYRIRSYLALDAAHGAVDWAWDVYDSEQHRVLRLNGAEAAGGAPRRAWTADDPLLKRIAQAGLQQLAAFMAGGPAAPGGGGPAAPAPALSGPAVAFASER